MFQQEIINHLETIDYKSTNTRIEMKSYYNGNMLNQMSL